MTAARRSDTAVIVVARQGEQACLQPFLAALTGALAGGFGFDWVWVWDRDPAGDPSLHAMQSQLEAWRRGGGAALHTAVGEAVTLDAAIAATDAPWLLVCGLDLPQLGRTLAALAAAARAAADAAVLLAIAAADAPVPAQALQGQPASSFERLPRSVARLLRRSALPAPAFAAIGALRASLAVDVLTWWALLQPGARVSLLALPHATSQGGADGASVAEPDVGVWREPRTYDAALRLGFEAPLAAAAAAPGGAPRWLQSAVLDHLHWYFTVDGRQRAPTVACDASQAPLFHDRMRSVMLHIDAASLAALPAAQVGTEVRHALWSYRAPVLQSAVSADAVDHALGLLRLTWWVHGAPPAERITVDGREVAPRYAKHRACNYFGRLLLRQRIVWLPVPDSGTVEVRLDGEAARIDVGSAGFTSVGGAAAGRQSAATTRLSIADARTAHPANKGGQRPLPPRWDGWRVRLLKGMARLPWVRRRYRDAWVFIDREEDADDSAEHLYRWVREHHPAINCWFLLLPGTADWKRLGAEGFRLVGPGLARKLLILNSRHVISSHTDYVFGGMDRRLYGDAMRWRATFLQHGVIKDDLTHWLGPREFDRFITSSPQEHASIVGDDTGYPYTDREVRRTGLPRHDRLLRLADALPPEEVRTLLVMPTWRASLVDERMAARSEAERLSTFAASDYARHWRALLNDSVLAERVAAAGLRIAFMPHANAAPYLRAFEVPPHVDVVRFGGNEVQAAFARSAALITDYTSVAFTMALLRRQVFYYQFDRDSFYTSGHNWRAGYFDYDRDGFGPVALDADALMAHLLAFIDGGCKAEPRYLERMVSAIPDRDDQACSRTFDSIVALDG